MYVIYSQICMDVYQKIINVKINHIYQFLCKKNVKVYFNTPFPVLRKFTCKTMFVKYKKISQMQMLVLKNVWVKKNR